jgi:hypothetical protein
MALNLNKGGEENSKPSTEKKGLNLSKSGDTAKTGLNLNKEEIVAKDSSPNKSEAIEPGQKKNNPVIFILLAALIVGGVLFWILNKDKTAPEGDNPVSTTPATTNPVNTANSQGQVITVPPQTAAKSDSSTSSSPGSNVSTSSNNVTKSNKVEGPKDKPVKEETSISTSAPSTTMSVGSIDEKVNQVLSGNFGNGLERRRALGDEYAAIQAKVNELYKNKNN